MEGTTEKKIKKWKRIKSFLEHNLDYVILSESIFHHLSFHENVIKIRECKVWSAFKL